MGSWTANGSQGRQQSISSSYRIRMWTDECKIWSLCYSRYTQHSSPLTSYEANDIVAKSRKNALETGRRLQKQYDSMTGRRKRNLLRTIVSLGRCSLLELRVGSCEIKFVGNQPLVFMNWINIRYPVWIANEKLRLCALEIVTDAEVTFGLTIRDSKPNDMGSRGHSDPMDVDAVAKEKGHRSRVMFVSSTAKHLFNESVMYAKARARKSFGKSLQS